MFGRLSSEFLTILAIFADFFEKELGERSGADAKREALWRGGVGKRNTEVREDAEDGLANARTRRVALTRK